ncbi:MAG: hypothetical protein ABIT01_02065 [Thermoanaerobaculia bacterium]
MSSKAGICGTARPAGGAGGNLPCNASSKTDRPESPNYFDSEARCRSMQEAILLEEFPAWTTSFPGNEVSVRRGTDYLRPLIGDRHVHRPDGKPDGRRVVRLQHENDLAWEEANRTTSVRPAFPAWTRSLTHTPVRSTFRLELLVPLADNDGVPFTDSTFADFEDSLVRLAGGFTRHGDVEGAWRSPEGRIHRDRSRAYVVSVPSSSVDRIASILDTEVRRRFRQEATFLEQLPTRAVSF